MAIAILVRGLGSCLSLNVSCALVVLVVVGVLGGVLSWPLCSFAVL
jgi:hypothetical protein